MASQADISSSFPIPESPHPSAEAHDIELLRAAAAAAAARAGPAITPAHILLEDEWLAVVNKPSGVYCEHVLASMPFACGSAPYDSNSFKSRWSSGSVGEDAGEPGPLGGEQAGSSASETFLGETCNRASERSNKGSLMAATKRGSRRLRTAQPFYLVNRLDRDTSGVMILAKSATVAGQLSSAFASREVEKRYVALCHGCERSWARCSVETGHGRSRNGMWRLYAATDVGRELPGGSRVRMAETMLEVAHLPGIHGTNTSLPLQVACEDGTVRHSISHTPSVVEPSWTVAQENRGSEGGCVLLLARSCEHSSQETAEATLCLCGDVDHVFVEARPQTGRTHQLRLHCQRVGHPIVGDVRYGGKVFWLGLQWGAHCLHAKSVKFRHPKSNCTVTVEAPLPAWTSALCGKV